MDIFHILEYFHIFGISTIINMVIRHLNTEIHAWALAGMQDPLALPSATEKISVGKTGKQSRGRRVRKTGVQLSLFTN